MAVAGIHDFAASINVGEMPEVLTAESFENVPLINAHRGDALGVYPGRNGTFIAMLSCALFSILFNALAYQQEVKVGFCFNATRYPDGPTYLAPAFSRLGYLFELAAFFAFCWYVASTWCTPCNHKSASPTKECGG